MGHGAGAELPLCPVCYETLGQYGGPASLPCGHNGCVDCFRTVQARRAECPLCRCPFNASTPLVCNHELRDLITLATCLFLEAKTEEVEDGWEQFPTAAVTTEHYASEVKLQQLARATHTAMQPHTLSAAQPISSARHNNGGYGGYNRHGSSSGGSCSSSHPGDPYHHHNMQRMDGDGQMISAPSAPPELGSYYDDGGNHGNGGVLALEPPQWLPDSYASSCGSCHLAFRPLVRLRHHCRLCGKVFCHACSAQEMLLPPRYAQREPQRVCGLCSGLLRPLQPYLAGTLSGAAQPPVHDAHDAISLRTWVNNPWSSRMEEDLFKAANLLRTFCTAGRLGPEKMLPAALLQGAHGLALLSMVRVGAGWSAAYGTGLLVSRNTPQDLADAASNGRSALSDSSSSWSAPCAIAFVGVGWGLQIGADLTDLLIVLPSAEAVQSLCSGVHVGVGGSAGISVGPVGRSADASVALGRSRNTQMFSYSCSKGAYVGVGVQSSLVMTRSGANSRFYGHRVTAKQLLLERSVPQPPAASLLYDGLHQLMQKYETCRPVQLSQQHQQQQQQQALSHGSRDHVAAALGVPHARPVSASSPAAAGFQPQAPVLSAGTVIDVVGTAMLSPGAPASSNRQSGSQSPPMTVPERGTSAASLLSRSVPSLPIKSTNKSVYQAQAVPAAVAPVQTPAAVAAIARSQGGLYPQVPTHMPPVPVAAQVDCRESKQLEAEDEEDPYGCLFD